MRRTRTKPDAMPRKGRKTSFSPLRPSRAAEHLQPSTSGSELRTSTVIDLRPSDVPMPVPPTGGVRTKTSHTPRGRCGI
eukprot:712279-Prymnesium_polylepis.1